MKMLRKIIDCESFENSQESVYDGVYFNKVASLQCIIIIVSTFNS